MDIQGLRVRVIVFSLLAGLVALFGLEQAYRYSRVDQPLARFLAERRDVAEFRVREVGGLVVLRLRLGRVDNLRETYVALEEGTRSILGARPFRLEIEDSRDQRLVDDYYRLHYTIQEGLSTGRFTEMADALRARAAELGLDEARVYVDVDRLYVQLRRGDRYLYEVIPRGGAAALSAAPGGGARP